MRRNIWLTGLLAAFVIPACGWSRAAGQGQTRDQSAQAPATQQDSLADAARRAKQQKQNNSKPPKVFTNDNLPTNASVSVSGSTSAEPSGKPGDTTGSKPATSDEK